jgi:hypothetical protein
MQNKQAGVKKASKQATAERRKKTESGIDLINFYVVNMLVRAERRKKFSWNFAILFYFFLYIFRCSHHAPAEQDV